MTNKSAINNSSFEIMFDQFIQHNRPRLLAYTLRLLPPAEAEEVIQETHMKFYSIAVSQIAEIKRESDIANYTPLLFSIAKNLSLSRIRHQQVVNKHRQSVYNDYLDREIVDKENSQLIASSFVQQSTKHSINIENSILERDEKDRLQQAIESLPPMCKQVFVQRKIYNRSHSEIASMFDISTKTVENHIARGLLLCRKFMLSSRSHNLVGNNKVKIKGIAR